MRDGEQSGQFRSDEVRSEIDQTRALEDFWILIGIGFFQYLSQILVSAGNHLSPH